jgi:peptidyl-prolyl cis-trans isomerase C
MIMNVNNKSACCGSKFVIAAVVVVIGAACAYKFLYSDGNLYKGVPVVAHVDGKPVYLSQAEDIVAVVIPPKDGKQVQYNDLDEKSKTMIIREVAAQTLMLKEAKTKGIVEDVVLKRKVAEYKNKLIRDQLFTKIANAEVSQDKIVARYSEIEKEVKGKNQIKVSHILLDSEGDAKKAEAALEKEGFSKVAKEFSRDSSTKDRGGDLGYMLSGAMDPDFEKAVNSLKTGEVSSPVKTKFGWHLIKLEEKRVATMPSLDVLKQRIAQDLYAEALKKYADSILTNVKIDLAEAKAEKDAGKAGKPDDKPAKDAPKNDSKAERK